MKKTITLKSMLLLSRATKTMMWTILTTSSPNLLPSMSRGTMTTSRYKTHNS